LDDGAIGIEHLPDGGGHPVSVHPVERLGEADDLEGAEGSGEILGSHLDPDGVSDLFPRGSALGLSQHSGIWVESNDALEEVGEEQSGGAWPATDVEEATVTI
jgi:hypothetical protein